MFHKSPILRLVCIVAWAITGITAVSIGATPLGWNLLAAWLMSMPLAYYVILAAGVFSLVGLVHHVISPECHS